MKNENDTVGSDQFQRSRRPKTREVSSRFISPSSTTPSLDIGVSSSSSSPSINQSISPTHRKSRTSSFDARKHRSQEGSVLVQGLWPHSSSSIIKKFDTLADHLGNERLKDQKPDNVNGSLKKQNSSTELSRFEREKEFAKENDRPIIGGSLRYCGKLNFNGNSSSSSSSSSKLQTQTIDSGRLSVDENALFGKSSRQKSNNFRNSVELESDCSDIYNRIVGSPTSGKSSIISSRKSGIVVSSKYMKDIPRRPQRGSSDSNIPNPNPNPVSFDGSPTAKKTSTKNAIQRTNSLSGYGSSISQWALSPGRSGCSPMSVENKEKPISFSNLKPVRTSSKATGMEKLMNLGLDLFKSKKLSTSGMSPLGTVIPENVHQLRTLHNRLMQWRFANAKAHAVNGNLTNSAEANLLSAWHGIDKLQQSVLQKKLLLQKEKLEFKLNFILLSQLKQLEAWGDMERQHLTALSMTKECLHSVVCRVPLIEGAKIEEAHSISAAFRHASELAVSIKSMLIMFAPRATETASILSELAKVVIQEKLLFDETFELQRTISDLEIKERSLKCGIVQMKTHQQLKQNEEASTA